jgi:hypothetical protein
MNVLSRGIRRLARARARLAKRWARLRGACAPAGGQIKRRLPDFFICGAARAGTTSMWQYLRQHPDVFMPPAFEWKEPSYFCASYGVKDWDFYLSLFQEAGDKKRVGEASGPYLTSPESPGLIQQAIPNPQFIIMLRNPADRAYSKWKWMHQYGYEKISSFPEALAAEDRCRFENDKFKKNHGQYYHNFLYFRSGLYHAQVKRFFDTFGRAPVHVLIFEEFIRDPRGAVQTAYAFLDVDPGFVPQIEIHNPTVETYGPLDSDLRRRLLQRYADNIAQLEQLLGRDLKRIWV